MMFRRRARGQKMEMVARCKARARAVDAKIISRFPRHAAAVVQADALVALHDAGERQVHLDGHHREQAGAPLFDFQKRGRPARPFDFATVFGLTFTHQIGDVDRPGLADFDRQARQRIDLAEEAKFSRLPLRIDSI